MFHSPRLCVCSMATRILTQYASNEVTPWGPYNVSQNSIDCSAFGFMTEALTSGMVDLERLLALQSASLFSQDVCRCWKLGTGLCRPQALPSGSNLLLHFSAWRPFPSLPSGE